MTKSSEIFGIKLLTGAGLLELSVNEGEGLTVIGENANGKSEFIKSIYMRAKGVSYRGNSTKLSDEEKRLFDLEIGYFDGEQKVTDKQTVAELLERCGQKFNMLPTEVGDIFEIREDQLAQRLDKANGTLAFAVGLLSELVKDYKLLFIDDLWGLDCGLKGRLIPLLKAVAEENYLTYVIATADPMMMSLTEHTLLIERGLPVEYGRSEALAKKPRHPYTKWFFSSVRHKKGEDGVLINKLKGGKASKRGCRFASVCALADDNCRIKAPEFSPYERDQRTACHKI